jgi:hypothetical protein
MEAIEDKKVCPAVFLDIQQAFDKVWHTGLLIKLKQKLPLPALPTLSILSP